MMNARKSERVDIDLVDENFHGLTKKQHLGNQVGKPIRLVAVGPCVLDIFGKDVITTLMNAMSFNTFLKFRSTCKRFKDISKLAWQQWHYILSIRGPRKITPNSLHREVNVAGKAFNVLNNDGPKCRIHPKTGICTIATHYVRQQLQPLFDSTQPMNAHLKAMEICYKKERAYVVGQIKDLEGYIKRLESSCIFHGELNLVFKEMVDKILMSSPQQTLDEFQNQLKDHKIAWSQFVLDNNVKQSRKRKNKTSN
jgi:hypothetical protein